MTVKELREKSKAELKKLLTETQTALVSLRFKVTGRQETKVRQVRVLKRDVAKILTVLNETTKS